jgi:chemotaxis protein CheX
MKQVVSMKVEYINPFIQGSQNVLSMVCGEGPTLGRLFIKNRPYAGLQVSILIKIFGDISGFVVFTMAIPTACLIASRMMAGMAVTELDDMSKSAISELGNMISGNVATIFSGMGNKVDISTPDFFTDAYIDGVPSGSEGIVCMPLQLSDGCIFEVDLSLA